LKLDVSVVGRASVLGKDSTYSDGSLGYLAVSKGPTRLCVVLARRHKQRQLPKRPA
jgi:hypothetical protein